jgi:hypothetical protein
MKRSFFSLNKIDGIPEIEPTNVNTISHNTFGTIIQLLAKLSIMFIIFAGFVVLITVIIGLIFIYINCTRPSRIHKQIPIEYLDSNEIINYSDDISMSEHSNMGDI